MTYEEMYSAQAQSRKSVKGTNLLLENFSPSLEKMCWT